MGRRTWPGRPIRASRVAPRAVGIDVRDRDARPGHRRERRDVRHRRPAAATRPRACGRRGPGRARILDRDDDTVRGVHDELARLCVVHQHARRDARLRRRGGVPDSRRIDDRPRRRRAARHHRLRHGGPFPDARRQAGDRPLLHNGGGSDQGPRACRGPWLWAVAALVRWRPRGRRPNDRRGRRAVHDRRRSATRIHRPATCTRRRLDPDECQLAGHGPGLVADVERPVDGSRRAPQAGRDAGPRQCRRNRRTPPALQRDRLGDGHGRDHRPAAHLQPEWQGVD